MVIPTQQGGQEEEVGEQEVLAEDELIVAAATVVGRNLATRLAIRPGILVIVRGNRQGGGGTSRISGRCAASLSVGGTRPVEGRALEQVAVPPPRLAGPVYPPILLPIELDVALAWMDLAVMQDGGDRACDRNKEPGRRCTQLRRAAGGACGCPT